MKPPSENRFLTPKPVSPKINWQSALGNIPFPFTKKQAGIFKSRHKPTLLFENLAIKKGPSLLVWSGSRCSNYTSRKTYPKLHGVGISNTKEDKLLYLLAKPTVPWEAFATCPGRSPDLWQITTSNLPRYKHPVASGSSAIHSGPTVQEFHLIPYSPLLSTTEAPELLNILLSVK